MKIETKFDIGQRVWVIMREYGLSGSWQLDWPKSCLVTKMGINRWRNKQDEIYRVQQKGQSIELPYYAMEDTFPTKAAALAECDKRKKEKT